jgi:hypothetical protein
MVKTMKRPAGKITAGLLALVLLLCCAQTVYADPALTIVLEASGLTPQDEFEVRLNVTANPGISGYSLALQYDPDALEIAEGNQYFYGILNGNNKLTNDETPGMIYVTHADVDNTNGTGTLFSVRFHIKPSFAGASTTVSIGEGEPGETEFISVVFDGENKPIDYPTQELTGASVKSVTIDIPGSETILMDNDDETDLQFSDTGVSGTAAAKVNLNRGASYQATAILACYDATHKFVGCKTKAVTIQQGDTSIVFDGLNFTAEGAYMKIMLVESTGFTAIGYPINFQQN